MENVAEMLNRHEGRRKELYNDATGGRVRPVDGNITIGVGHNLSIPMDEDLIDIILNYDIRKATRETVKIFPDLYSYGNKRGSVLVCLMFNVGPGSFRTFTKLIEAVKAKDWGRAADELKDSDWYTQVDKSPGDGKGRGDEMVSMLR